MVALNKTLAALPPDGFRVEFGSAYWDGVEWWANVRGELLMARWMDPIQPQQGGKIVVAIMSDGMGLSSALVLGAYTEQPRPSTGSVLTVGVDEIVFSGDDGGTYATKWFIGPISGYAPGDPVMLSWDATRATIIGEIPVIAPPSTGSPLPPPVAVPVDQDGQETLIATASDTYGVGGWGRWAGSTGGGEQVYSGTYAGYTMTGSWFYGAPRPVLAGKTITRVQFRVPDRLEVGYNNSAATMHVYAHTSQSRPAGDVGRSVGPFDVVLAAHQDPAWVDLPTSFGAVIAAGGGISIAGDPYIGLNGRRKDPESGKLLIDWST